MNVTAVTYDRLLLIGGSTANGLGMREVPFGHRYRNPSGDAPEVLDLTASGKLLSDLDGDADCIRDFAPDLAIVCGGMAERLVHPPRWFQDLLERFAPEGWHGVAGLEPRAYLSRQGKRRRRQRLVGWLKMRVKRGAVAVGHSQRKPLDEVIASLRALLRELQDMGTTTVVLGTWTVDETMFPRSPAAFSALDDSLRALCREFSGAHYLQVSDVLDPWDDYLADRFHWGATGHAKVARAVEDLVQDLRPTG